MRVHINLDADLVKELDRRAGSRGRSRFVAEVVRRALEDAGRWEEIRAAMGSIADTGHEWDDDPAGWVHRQRFADSGRVG